MMRSVRLPARRRRPKNHLILGDEEEFKAALNQTQRDAPALQRVDVADLPSAIQEAMQLSERLHEPILQAYEAVLQEKRKMQQQCAELDGASSRKQSHATAAGALAATRNSRMLQKHAQHEKHWATEAARLGEKLGKDPKDVTLTRAIEFRKRREKIDHILKSKPVQDRVPGSTYWQLTLRNANVHYIPLGNEFSGLFTAIQEFPPELVTVPVEVLGKPEALDPVQLASATSLLRAQSSGLHDAHPHKQLSLMRTMYDKGRAWLQSGYLKSVEDKYSTSMGRLLSHPPDTSELAVFGNSVAAELHRLAHKPIGLHDVTRRLCATAPEAYEEYYRLQQHEVQRAREAAAAQLQALEDARAAAFAAAQPAGPVLSVDTDRLVLECHHSDIASGVITISAVGCSAVYFTWQRRSLCAASASAGQASEHSKSAIYMPHTRGTVLPGEARKFRFLFKPRCAGSCTEEWQLCTQPGRAEVCGGRIVTIRGIASEYDDTALERRTLAAHLHTAQRQRQVAAALEHVLRQLPEPQRPRSVLTDTHWQELHAFAAGTAHAQPPLYWQPGIQQQLLAIFDAARAALMPPSDPKKKPRKGEEAPQPPIPETFDGRIDSLQSYIEQVRGAQPAQLAPDAPSADTLSAHLDSVLEAAALPHQQGVLYARVLRVVLLQAADGVAEAASEAQRVAEERKAARRRATGDSAAPSPSVETAKPSEGAKGKGAKDAAPAAPAAAAFDPEEYTAELGCQVHSLLQTALSGTEGALEADLAHIGSKLDEHIAQRQAELVTAEAQGDDAAAAQASWDTFALLRKRHAHGVPATAAPLHTCAKPLHDQLTSTTRVQSRSAEHCNGHRSNKM